MNLEKCFTDYLEKRYYDFFHKIGPANAVQVRSLLTKMSTEESNSIIYYAEKLGMWHPDTIKLNKKILNLI